MVKIGDNPESCLGPSGLAYISPRALVLADMGPRALGLAAMGPNTLGFVDMCSRAIWSLIWQI